MSADTSIVIVATIAFALITLGIAASIDYRDWGLCGLMTLCGGVAVLGASSLLRETGRFRSWRPDLHWLWLLLVCVGAVLVIVGQFRRIKDGWRWPPRWRMFVRLVGAVLIPPTLLVLIHLIRGWAG
jgi:hypothetical protein